MDRRDFLGGVLGGLAVSAALPAVAGAGALPVDAGPLAWVEALRGRRAAARDRTRALFSGLEADPAVEAYGELVAGMAVIDRASEVPVADQAHPAFQALIGEVLEQVGRGVDRLGVLFAEVAEQEREPDEASLAAIFALAEEGIGGAEVSEASGRLHRNGLRGLHRRARERGLRAELRRQVRRLERLRELSAKIAEDPDSTGLLTPADDRVQAELAAGRRRWASAEDAAGGGGAKPTFWQIFGLVATGLGMLAGGLYLIGGIVCAIECGSAALIAALFGAAVLVGCLFGFLAILKAIRRRREGEAAVGGEPAFPVDAATGFRAVPALALDPARRYLVVARGAAVLLAGGPRLDASGDPRLEAGEGDLLEGVPLGALLGRCGASIFEIGAAGLLPAGLSGALELALNGPVGDRPGARGGVEATILALG